VFGEGEKDRVAFLFELVPQKLFQDEKGGGSLSYIGRVSAKVKCGGKRLFSNLNKR